MWQSLLIRQEFFGEVLVRTEHSVSQGRRGQEEGSWAFSKVRNGDAEPLELKGKERTGVTTFHRGSSWGDGIFVCESETRRHRLRVEEKSCFRHGLRRSSPSNDAGMSSSTSFSTPPLLLQSRVIISGVHLVFQDVELVRSGSQCSRGQVHSSRLC